MHPKSLAVRDVIKRLEHLGFEKVSQHGSRLKLRKETSDGAHTVVVPMHGKDIDHTQIAGILHKAGIEWDDLSPGK